MFSYYEKFQGRLALNLVFRAVGVTIKSHLQNSVPFLNACVDPAVNSQVCCLWMLGVCPFGDRCTNAASHKSKISYDFAKTPCLSIKLSLCHVHGTRQGAFQTRNPKLKTQ